MTVSDDKIRAMTLRIVRALEKDPDVLVRDSDTALRAVREGIEAGLKLLEEIHEKAKTKIRSLSHPVAEGTRQWDELFAKYVGEEYRRRGL
jgi:hypothetical protein